MPLQPLAPEFTEPDYLEQTLRRDGFGVLSPQGLSTLIATPLSELDALKPGWDDLPLDAFLKDGGSYRRRRHSCFIITAQEILQVPHRAHYQPLEYNALHGGMLRMFEPLSSEFSSSPPFRNLLLALARLCSRIKETPRWHVEAHQFRIDTRNGIGRPTPEGAHRDGVDFVAILFAGRHHVRGGESRVFAATGRHGQRFTLTEPWTLLLLDDQRVIHESTPIQPDALDGYRDTLVLTYRADGFLAPPPQADSSQARENR